MNKSTLYFLALTTAAVATSCKENTKETTLKTHNSEEELLELKLTTTEGKVFSPDSTLTITNFNQNTKIIYEHKRLNMTPGLPIDVITTYMTVNNNRDVILPNTTSIHVRGQNPELTDTLFAVAGKDWRKKINLFKEEKRIEEQKELDRLKAKEESEYNSARQKVYNIIDQIRK